MKKILCLAASLLALTFTPVFGQTTHAIDNATGQPIAQNKPELTKFDLDFPGGTPAELVKAIEKAMGRPLNVIIPPDGANVQLPPLKMSHVDVAQLFRALAACSPTGYVVGGFPNTQPVYSFSTENGSPSDDSIWSFTVRKNVYASPQPSKTCQFYSLAPYLDRGFKVDDITTAIQTGWKMAGITSPPKLEYHKETKLLIAYGEPEQLKTIDSVLKTLPASNATINEIGRMNSQINTLTKELNELKKKNFTSTPAAPIKERSGK